MFSCEINLDGLYYVQVHDLDISLDYYPACHIDGKWKNWSKVQN